jgi:uncharacterized membrane protein required for colicin V production
LNGLDFAILFAFMAIIGLGFFGGIARVVAAIIAIYIASIVAAMFYRQVAQVFREQVSSISEPTSELFIFMLLFLAIGAVTWFLVASALRGLKLPRKIEIADNLGGATLGVVVSAMAVTLAVMLISILLQVLNQTVGTGSTGALGNSLSSALDNSALVPIFLNVAPYFTMAIEPWFPGGTPSILKAV